MNLLIIRADDSIKDLCRLTLPGIRSYADKIGADFRILNSEPIILTGDGHPHYRIMDLYNLLEEYDRCICFDADMLVLPTCPNLFSVVPIQSIGTIYEDKGSRTLERLRRIRDIQNLYGYVSWNAGYINTGCFVVSKEHRVIFQPINGKEYYTGEGSDDVHLGWQIHKQGFKIHELEYKFNHMTMFSEAWSGHNRFDSYIIHYAGKGVFDAECKNKLEQIKKDILMM